MNHPYEKIGVSLPHSRTLEHQDMKELFVKIGNVFCSILTGITSFFSGVFSWVGKMISFHYLATA